MKTQEIFVLPQIPIDASFEEHAKAYKANWELAKIIDFIPDSLKTLKSIEYSQLKVLMFQNEKFRNAAIALCPKEIRKLIERDQRIARDDFEEGELEQGVYEKLLAGTTIDELIESGYYGKDYERALREILNVLVEDYLWSD